MAQMIIDSRHAVEGESLAVHDDFYFGRIGVPIRIMPPFVGDGYEPELLPSQALALCQRRHLLFVALSTGGFLMGSTNSVMLEMISEAAPAERRAMMPQVRNRVWTRVHLGRVRLLSLSPQSSMLAACVGGTVNFFLIEELVRLDLPEIPDFNPEEWAVPINLDVGPFFGRPFPPLTIDGGSSVKDMRWLDETSYILLASCGKLYRGRNNEPLILLMENVDAVDCSPNFDEFAAARNDRLSILSSNLDDEYHIPLSLHPWTPNSDDSRVKVDSLKWIYTNRIVLGCFQLTPDGMEESYRLLVTSPTGGGILRFDGVFPQIVEDIMPAGSGPHLFFSCLEDHFIGLAIAAHRKNVDQHIVLFDRCSGEQMACVNIDRDEWLPRIDLQENGDDNTILGLCTDVSYSPQSLNLPGLLNINQNLRHHHIRVLWCLSLEGKLIAFSLYRREPLNE